MTRVRRRRHPELQALMIFYGSACRGFLDRLPYSSKAYSGFPDKRPLQGAPELSLHQPATNVFAWAGHRAAASDQSRCDASFLPALLIHCRARYTRNTFVILALHLRGRKHLHGGTPLRCPDPGLLHHVTPWRARRRDRCPGAAGGRFTAPGQKEEEEEVQGQMRWQGLRAEQLQGQDLWLMSRWQAL